MWMCIYLIIFYELNSDMFLKNLFASGPLEVILKDKLRKLLDYSLLYPYKDSIFAFCVS